MKKVLFIIVPNFRDVEYFAPRKAIESAGAEVITASFNQGKVNGVEGGEATAYLSLSEVKAEDYDAIAFIGGQGMISHVGDQALINLAKTFFQAGKITAAICIAPMILAKAGILANKKATVCEGKESDLENLGAIFSGENITVDGNIITANGPSAAEEFGKNIIKLLAS